MKKEELYIDVITFLSIFFLSVFAVHFLSDFLRKIIFLSFFILAWISKKDYLWITLTFVFITSPAGFFPQGSFELEYRLPLFNIAPGLSFNTTDIFVILFFIKALFKEKIYIYFQKIIYPFLLLILTATIIGIYLKTSIDHLANEYRMYFTFTMFYSSIKLIRDSKNLLKIYILLVTILPVIVLNQILGFFDSSLLSIIGKEFAGNIGKIEGSDEVKRVGVIAVLILFWLLIYSLVFIYKKKSSLLQIIVILLICSVFFLSATRVWIFIGFVTLILSLILGKRIKFNNYILIILLFIGLLYIAANFIGKEQINASWERFFPAMKLVVSGDMEKVETINARLEALKIIKKYIAINPFTGLGFSEMHFYSNDHGFWNTLLTFGYFGLAVFISIFLYIYYSLFKTWKIIGGKNAYYYPLRMLFVGFTGIMVGYATTWDFFHSGANRIFFSCLFIGAINIYICEALGIYNPKINLQ